MQGARKIDFNGSGVPIYRQGAFDSRPKFSRPISGCMNVTEQEALRMKASVLDLITEARECLAGLDEALALLSLTEEGAVLVLRDARASTHDPATCPSDVEGGECSCPPSGDCERFECINGYIKDKPGPARECPICRGGE